MIRRLSHLSRFLLCAVAAVLLAQDQTQLVLNAQAPPPVSSAGASYNGVPNTPGVSIYYWVVARYPAGTAIPRNSAQVQRTPGAGNLSAANSVTISWNAMPSATGYDVLRSETNQFPAQIACLCAVALNVAGTTFTDTGAGVFQYPPAGITVATDAQMVQTIDNLTESFPIIRLTLNGQVFRMPPFTGQATGGAVVITNGIMSAATGSPTDCVKVNGTSGACGGGTGTLNMQVNSVLVGTRDTQNVVAGANGGLIFSGADTGTKVNITGSVDRSTVAYVTDTQNGVINSASGATGTASYAACPGLPWTELPRAWSRSVPNLTNIVVASNVATATVSAGAPATGKYVYVWGATVDTDMNGGPYLVTNTSGTTFTFPVSAVTDGTYTEATLSLGQAATAPLTQFFPSASTGAVTLNLCGLGSRKWLTPSGVQAGAGDIAAASTVTAVYRPEADNYTGAFQQIGGGSSASISGPYTLIGASRYLGPYQFLATPFSSLTGYTDRNGATTTLVGSGTQIARIVAANAAQVNHITRAITTETQADGHCGISTHQSTDTTNPTYCGIVLRRSGGPQVGIIGWGGSSNNAGYPFQWGIWRASYTGDGAVSAYAPGLTFYTGLRCGVPPVIRVNWSADPITIAASCDGSNFEPMGTELRANLVGGVPDGVGMGILSPNANTAALVYHLAIQ